MFQNIADEEIQKDNINENIKEKINDSKINYILKEIFKVQNIIIYIITFLISTLSINNANVPFGLAMVAACVGEEIPVIGVFISAIIGTAIGNGINGLGTFLLNSIIYFALVIIFNFKIAVDERNEVIKTGGKLFFSCIIVPIIKNIFGVFLFYDVFMAVITSSLIYVFYKIFVNGLIIIENFKEKHAFTIEELIASTIIIAIASTSFNSFNIFGLSISNIIIIFMIMFLGWQYGMAVGAVSGVSIGLAICFVSEISFVQIGMFAISGILSGLLNRFGKIGVIIGFLLGNTLLTYWVRGASTMIIYFREIFIASIGLLLVPNRIKIELDELFGKNILISNTGENRLNSSREDISTKLKTISDLFENINIDSNKEIISFNENLLQDFLDNLEELSNNIFYEEISKEENGIAKDICDKLLENDIILDNDLVQILQNHNNYVFLRDQNIKNDLQEIIKIANRTLKTAQINRIKEQEKNKAKEELQQNLKNVSKYIKEYEKEANINIINEFEKKEKEIEILLKSKSIDINKCNIKKLKNNKIIVSLDLDNNNLKLREKDVMTNICDTISKSIGTKMSLQREKINDENEEYFQIYSSEDKYVLQVGSSKVTKDGSNVSGDCSLQIKLADGKYLLAISDGMGTGEKARECSKITLKLLKQILSAGFNNEETIRLLNTKMNLINKKEMYSTLDASILDLYAGNVNILKNGASNTYIKNKKTIRKIESKNMPIGIIDDIELQEEKIPVSDGDIIVMCSDGVLDTKDEASGSWIAPFLKNISTNNVQKISDLILAEAIDNNFGIAQDDMTVIVSKIVSKKR